VALINGHLRPPEPLPDDPHLCLLRLCLPVRCAVHRAALGKKTVLFRLKLRICPFSRQSRGLLHGDLVFGVLRRKVRFIVLDLNTPVRVQSIAGASVEQVLDPSTDRILMARLH
jgi:hypothetical protein